MTTDHRPDGLERTKGATGTPASVPEWPKSFQYRTEQFIMSAHALEVGGVRVTATGPGGTRPPVPCRVGPGRPCMGQAETHWARSRLAIYALFLASAVILGIGVALAFADRDLGSREIASAIGLNLIASVLFALIFSYISGNIQERLLLERIEGLIGETSQELLGKLAGYQAHYMPAATYGAGEQWHRAYNDDVTTSLLGSALYAFRGTSAKYVASRLRRAPRGTIRHVDIVMLDPRSDRVLQARAAIKQDQTSTSKEVPELAEDIKNEILMSVVALFNCRHSYRLKIAFVADVAATRIELFDDAAYISWYQCH
jgi:hypothetical protein